MASSSSSPKTTRKPAGKGRRKIEIKKVDQTNKRLVTFSKRKLGLFRKAAELSLPCDSQIAVIVFSQFSKVFSSGYPDPDAVISRYLSGASSSFSYPTSVHKPEKESAMPPLRQEFEEALKVLEEEKKSLNVDISGDSGCGNGFWWNRSVEEMGLEELVQFKECAEQLRQNVAIAVEKKKSQWLIDLQPPPVTMAESMYISLLDEDDMSEFDRQ